MTRLKIGGRLDRYVGRLFAASYLSAFALVVGLYVIVDLSVNFDEYLVEHPDGSTASLLTIAHYYLLHLPFLYLEMSPFVTLVAGLFTAARLVRNNELVAGMGAGVSSRRMFAPIYVGALVLAGCMFLLREWATDSLGHQRDALREYLLEQSDEVVYHNLWVRDTDGMRLRLEEYRPVDRQGRGLLARFTGDQTAVAIDAERIWAPTLVGGRWRWSLEGGSMTHVDADERRREALHTFDAVNVGPADVELAWRGRERPLDLSFVEASALLERDPDNLQYKTVRQYCLTFPLAGLLLLLVGLPFLVTQERGRGVERVAVGILLCMAYFAVDFVMRTLGLQGQVGPIYAAWVPLVLFGSLGLVLTASMRT